MDVPVVLFGIPTLPCATQRDAARPEQVSQPLALRQGATCHSLQRRDAEEGVATNTTSGSRHVTISARREAEAGVAATRSSTTGNAALSAVWVDDASHTYSIVQKQIR
jgi:hypothetical protein